MPKDVLFLPEAMAELLDTVDHYEKIYPGLGLDFELEVKKVVNLLVEFPEICSKRDDGTQRMSTHRFPYQVVFCSHIDTLWIISVAHHKRFPEH